VTLLDNSESFGSRRLGRACLCPDGCGSAARLRIPRRAETMVDLKSPLLSGLLRFSKTYINEECSVSSP